MTSKPRSRSLRAVSISTLRTTYRFRRYARRIDFDATHDVSISTLRTTYRFRRYARRIDFDATYVVSISTLRTSYRSSWARHASNRCHPELVEGRESRFAV